MHDSALPQGHRVTLAGKHKLPKIRASQEIMIGMGLGLIAGAGWKLYHKCA